MLEKQLMSIAKNAGHFTIVQAALQVRLMGLKFHPADVWHAANL